MPNTWSVFDVIGPVMIGPSSSHTAGACKLGYMARIIFGQRPEKVKLKLHGSFGEVYAGHCTDVALVGGLLGMLPSNPDIKNAYELAEKAGMEIELIPTNLGAQYHPNTVLFQLERDERKQIIVGSSTGGGKIEIIEIDKVSVNITGAYSSLLVCYDSFNFNLQHLLELAKRRKVSIVSMETTKYKNKAILDIEIREYFEPEIIKEIENLEGIFWARFLNHISNYEY